MNKEEFNIALIRSTAEDISKQLKRLSEENAEFYPEESMWMMAGADFILSLTECICKIWPVVERMEKSLEIADTKP